MRLGTKARRAAARLLEARLVLNEAAAQPCGIWPPARLGTEGRVAHLESGARSMIYPKRTVRSESKEGRRAD